MLFVLSGLSPLSVQVSAGAQVRNISSALGRQSLDISEMFLIMGRKTHIKENKYENT